MRLDKWQEEVLQTQGNLCLRSGRQVGKSTVVAMKASLFAVENARSSIMVISATERQAYLLYSKILAHLLEHYPRKIKQGKDRPTKTQIQLLNGSIIRCLPTGLEGMGIRGYTCNLLIADEAAFIPEGVFPALTPMLATTGGAIWLLSTPHGREGFFYECFKEDSGFKTFHINTQEVAEGREEPTRSNMIKNLEVERDRMTECQFAQEYLGEFVDELRQLFSDELIKKVQNEKRRPAILKNRDYYLGVDVARMGRNDSTFEIIQRVSKDSFIHVENLVTSKTLTTATTDLIIQLDSQYDFKKIYVDDGGVGAAVFDMLLRDDKTKRKVVAINNSNRPLDKNEKVKKKILKEDLYMNLLVLLEKNKLRLLDDPEIYLSLKSVQYEYTDEGAMKIYGNFTDIVEGLVRAAWCNREKGFNIWVR